MRDLQVAIFFFFFPFGEPPTSASITIGQHGDMCFFGRKRFFSGNLWSMLDEDSHHMAMKPGFCFRETVPDFLFFLRKHTGRIARYQPHTDSLKRPSERWANVFHVETRAGLERRFVCPH